MGKIYVASKNMRGEWAPRPEGAIVIDVTSAQRKDAPNRLCFSPMTMKTYTDAHEGSFPNFEAYWQSLKVIESVPHAQAKQWWKAIDKPKRRHPKMKKNRVLHSEHGRLAGQQLGYVESRKKVYVPDYYDTIKNSMQLIDLQRGYIDEDRTYVIYDFDGPRDDDKKPVCEEVGVEMLKRKINDDRVPFGHGYVVAAALAGIKPELYV